MSDSMIDWDLAVNVGARIAGPGPQVSAAEASEVVAELRAGAARSTAPVREFTGLVTESAPAEVLVVDRRGWIRANADGFATVLSPVIAKIEERKGAPSGFSKAVGSRVTGAEVGGLLGFLGGKVLGQFDPFYSPTESQSASRGAGRLLLVAPNIVHVEQELDVDPHDFRLWVCLHEETHRVQFTAVPWMRDYILGLIESLVTMVETDPSRIASFLQDAVKRAGTPNSPAGAGSGGTSILELLSTPEQRELLDQITAVMSLLEGHADVVMDGVGPDVIPSVATIRRRFNARRKGGGVLDRALRRLLGLEAKMAQYREGAGFAQTVIEQVGMEGFNKVWVEPDHLPTRAEINDPGAWVRRVHGP